MSNVSPSAEPAVVAKPAFTIIGVTFTANLVEIMEQKLGKKAYETVLNRKQEIVSRLSDDVYLVQVYPYKPGFNAQVDAFTQYIGYVVTEETAPPEGMAVRSFPERQYVKVTHYGLESELSRTYDLVYGKWMRENGRHPDSFDFEIWDERYKPEQPDNEIDLYVALANSAEES
ncbi:GyrI-like domain-containing protein [Paenibacillus sp. J2TS4]|uniref:GyrI-like domain-containing protein n=1 Tax=Paenibacillus sp. J2TS4 TaxID=2807194 RepID=UPI001B23D9B1|nr:GyrI-like domain-containing protein [Paenibacillus sp. J2TS4]GIP34707.1 hypothetical protein J2TS4_39170 [Paenibacillus sp. J2TS4]